MKTRVLMIAVLVIIFLTGFFAYLHVQNYDELDDLTAGFQMQNKNKYALMSELFQQKYVLTYGVIMDEAKGATTEYRSTDSHGNSITLIIKENLNGPYHAKIICKHDDWRGQETIYENILEYLENEDCFSPIPDETPGKQ